MFLVMITYTKPIEEINNHLVEHRAFLSKGYENNQFIVAGPQNPRTGGVLISQMTDREELSKLLKNDPFLIHDVANYEIIEFLPVKCHKDFEVFMTPN